MRLDRYLGRGSSLEMGEKEVVFRKGSDVVAFIICDTDVDSCLRSFAWRYDRMCVYLSCTDDALSHKERSFQAQKAFLDMIYPIKSLGQSITMAGIRATGTLSNDPTLSCHQPINQSTNPPIHQTINHLINQSINQSVERLMNDSNGGRGNFPRTYQSPALQDRILYLLSTFLRPSPRAKVGR